MGQLPVLGERQIRRIMWNVMSTDPPEKEGKYLVCVPMVGTVYVGIGWWNGEEWTLLPEPIAKSVTHWRELPELPWSLKKKEDSLF